MSDERPSTADIAVETTDEPPVESEENAERTDGQEGSDERLEPLLGSDDTGGFRERWQSIQVAFVDEPRQAVEQADSLVAELMQRLAETFHEERENLESQWSRGDDVSTEDLRVGLKRYRSFFERLLST